MARLNFALKGHGFSRAVTAERLTEALAAGEVSRLLKQACPDLLPRDDIGWVLLMPSDSVIKFRPLRVCE